MQIRKKLKNGRDYRYVQMAVLIIITLGVSLFSGIMSADSNSLVTSGVENLSATFSTFLSKISNYIPLGFAFGAGMVAAVNPCGFAMLPAYLGLYAGEATDRTSSSVVERVFHSSLVGASITTGFVILFAIVGISIASGAQILVDVFPWAGLGIGVILIIVGSWIISTGNSIYSMTPMRLSAQVTGVNQQNLRGYFLFGLSYGIASLSCTLPIFLTVIGSTLTIEGFFTSAAQFALYGLGMGALISLLTLGIALFREAFIRKIRVVLPYIQAISSGLLIVAGAYIVYYWLTLGGILNSVI